MKRVFNILILLIIVSILPIKAERLGDDAIIERAVKFLELNKKEFANKAEIDKESLTPYVYEGDTCYYSINITTGGWILLANETKSTPYLAYSFNGAYPTREEMPGGMQTLVDWYAETILVARELDIPDQPLMETAISITVDPMLGENLKWAQSGDSDSYIAYGGIEYAFNRYCPAIGGPNGHAYVGCTAVAMGIIMKKWNWPKYAYIPNSISSNGTPSSSTHLVIYNWDFMPDTIVSLGADRTQKERVAEIAGLLRDCGYAAEMEYGSNGSSSNITKAKSAFRNTFSYSTSSIKHKNLHTSSNWQSMLETEMLNQRPVYYRAVNSNNEGHAFVIDGLASNGYFHIQWGWRGNYNNYFSLTSDMIIYENNSIDHPNAYPFTSYFQALIDIKPDPSCTNISSYSTTVTDGQTVFKETTNSIDVTSTVEDGGTLIINSEGALFLRPGFMIKNGGFGYFNATDLPCEQ